MGTCIATMQCASWYEFLLYTLFTKSCFGMRLSTVKIYTLVFLRYRTLESIMRKHFMLIEEDQLFLMGYAERTLDADG